MFTCIIVEDDIFSLKSLQQLLKKYDDLICLKSFADPLLASDYLQTNTVDIIFLDIQMPQISGLELRNKIHQDIEVIFTTSSPNFALSAFHGNVTDYLVKPLDAERLDQALKKAFKNSTIKKNAVKYDKMNVEEGHIAIKHKNKNYNLKYSDIVYIESNREYVKYNTVAGIIVDYGGLSKVYSSLPHNYFMRIHRCYIVNIKFIKSYNNRELLLKTNQIIPVGKMWRTEVLQKISNS